MLIHGRLHLTPNGLMLDEVRSLLQKALRRPQSARDLALQCCRELIGYGKDQLPWKCMVTFLFEDHCLVDANVLGKFLVFYRQGSKYSAVELLLQCETCRIAACLPVVAMETEYDPVSFGVGIQVPNALKGLLEESVGKLKFDVLLTHIQSAWKTKDSKALITWIKLASIAHDEEGRPVTKKGEHFLIEKTRSKASVGLLVLSAIYKVTPVGSLREYIRHCFQFCAIPDVCVRLVLFSAVTQVMYEGEVKPVVDLKGDNVQWNKIPKLSSMPSWAVDKHTFRGKFGKGTKHLVKKRPDGMTEKQYEEFHGNRPKTDLAHFFAVGSQIERPSVPTNPYWEQTQEIYYRYPPRQQKTTQMTKQYLQALKHKYPNLFHASAKDNGKSKTEIQTQTKADSDKDMSFSMKKRTMDCFVKREPKKRKMSEAICSPSKKRRCDPDIGNSDHSRGRDDKLSNINIRAAEGEGSSPGDDQGINVHSGEDGWDDLSDQELLSACTHAERAETDYGTKTTSMDTETTTVDTKTSTMDTKATVVDNKNTLGDASATHLKCRPKGPLLQLPTGGGKVYAVLDLETKNVVKGPYTLPSLQLCLFLHKTLREVLGDPNVLPVEDKRPFLEFPLVCSSDAKFTIVRKPFYDAIGKCEVAMGEFIDRDTLGVIQLHRLRPDQLKLLPPSIWIHFMYRFALNVGDSGLYNAITDRQMSFVYGIDIEGKRGRVARQTILDYMFPKLPAKTSCAAIMDSLKRHKETLMKIMCKETNYSEINKLAVAHEVTFNRQLFIERVTDIRKALSTL